MMWLEMYGGKSMGGLSELASGWALKIPPNLTIIMYGALEGGTDMMGIPGGDWL